MNFFMLPSLQSCLVVLLCVIGAACGSEEGATADAERFTIRLDSVFFIGRLEDPFTPDLDTEFAITRSYLVAGIKGGVVVFDLTGKPLRVLDRSGGGPGEFAGPVTPLSLGGDSVLAIDRSSGRYVTLDIAGGSTSDPGTLGMFAGDVSRHEGRWLVSFPEIDGDSVTPVHWVDQNERSYPAGRISLAEFRDRGGYSVALVDDRAVWSPRNQFSIAWAQQGEASDTLAYVPLEFESSPPGPTGERAWIMRLAPKPPGKRIVVTWIASTGREGTLEDALTTWIEVLDLDRAGPIARASFPGLAGMTRDGGWIYRFDGQHDIPRVHFSRVVLEPQ